MIFYRLAILLLFGLVTACNVPEPNTSQPIAVVKNIKLYEEDLPEWLKSSDDSLHLREAYIDKWVRKKIMLQAAETNVKEDINIEKLVNDYKESLLMHHFEMQILATKMDSTVTNNQILNYYDQHTDEFLLQEEALRVRYLKCATNAETDKLKKLWSSKKTEQVASSSGLPSCTTQWLNSDSWVTKTKIASTMPDAVKKRISWSDKKVFSIESDSTLYLLDIQESLEPRSKAPLALVRESILKLILHKRRKQVMQDYEEKLVQEGIKNKFITLSQ